MHCSDTASPPSAPAHRAARDSEFRVPRGDAVPALPSSAPSGAWRQQAGTRPQSESRRGRSVRPARSTPRKWPCASGRQEHGSVTKSLSAVSEARIGKMRTRARWDCALSIQRLEGSRSAADAGVMQIQLRKSRCGSTPGEPRKSTAPRRENVRVAENSNVVRRG
jgi:hypothetical protein